MSRTDGVKAKETGRKPIASLCKENEQMEPARAFRRHCIGKRHRSNDRSR